MISRRKEIFFVALCVVFSALFTIGCSDSLLHPAQDGTRILVQLENSSLRSGDTPPPTEKWQGSAWIENRDGSESHHQKISSETDELSITFENIVIGSEIRIHLDVTSSSETAKRYRGSSSWKKIIDGVNVIVIVLKEVEVDAATPTITKQPEGKTESFAAGGTQNITKELMVEASVSDGGALTYQWYSNTSNSTTGGTAIGGATSSSYEATANAKETKYFYCIVTNTNNNVSGNKTASVTSNVAILASIEGSLESITARYNGTNLWVGVSSTDFTVIENYSGGKSVETPLANGSYTVEVPENSIGNVPVTIKSKDGSIQTQITVPIKYELDVSNLTITGGATVTQGGNLVLTAQYKTVDGADVEYKLYDKSGSSNTYKVIEKVNIYWTGNVQQSSTWEALADTATAGQKTATVKLISTDEWCVTTDGIEKIHRYAVNAATSGGSGPSNQAELVQAIADASEGDTITIYNTIIITDTLVIDKNINIEGSGDISLLRDNNGTVTGPMIEVKMGVTLDLSSITLNGQWNNSYTSGENNPLIYVNTGNLLLTGVTLKNNHMVYWGKYTDKNDQKVDLYAAAAIYALDSQLTILDSTFTDFSANDEQGGVINIEGTSPDLASITIINSTVDACGGSNSRALQMGSSDDVFSIYKYISYDINNKVDGLTRQITSITPTSP